jgi:hypothetical protein
VSIRWRRRGIVAAPPPDAPLWKTHAQCPTVLALRDDLWRIFVGGRDAQNTSRTFAVDVDPTREMAVVTIHRDPVLELGPPGQFDACGLVGSCVVPHAGGYRMYYAAIPTRSVIGQAIGIAASDDGLHFARTGEPVLAPSATDRHLVTMPYVRPHGRGMQMWYSSGTDFPSDSTVLEPRYALFARYSGDGLTWDGERFCALDGIGEKTFGIARPWVQTIADGTQWLWFALRGEHARLSGPDAYRIAQVEVRDGSTPHLRDARPIEFENPPQEGDWDSWMQSYPCVVPYGDTLAMFYNGDEFGRNGFGWATA